MRIDMYCTGLLLTFSFYCDQGSRHHNIFYSTLVCCPSIINLKKWFLFSFYQVTLSEGPNHMAQFKGSSHQYDLTQEDEV